MRRTLALNRVGRTLLSAALDLDSLGCAIHCRIA